MRAATAGGPGADAWGRSTVDLSARGMVARPSSSPALAICGRCGWALAPAPGTAAPMQEPDASFLDAAAADAAAERWGAP